MTQHALGGRGFTLCIDETGERKKGNTTDYCARQYIGNVGKIENGIVSVNAYGVLEDITFPLVFQVFKPEKRLKVGDTYRTKPQLAIELIEQLQQRGFAMELVLADCLYGESGTFVEALLRQHLPFVVALRDHHGVWLGPGEHIRSTRWRSFERVFSDETHQTRSLREIIFAQRGTVRYYQLTNDPTAREQDKAMVGIGQLDHLQADAVRLRLFSRVVPGVSLVHKGDFHRLASGRLDVLSQARNLVTVLLIGRCDVQRQQMPQGVHCQMDFAAALSRSVEEWLFRRNGAKVAKHATGGGQSSPVRTSVV